MLLFYLWMRRNKSSSQSVVFKDFLMRFLYTFWYDTESSFVMVHKFLTTTLNEYQGLLTLLAFIIAASPFAFKRVRKWFGRRFSVKELHERMDTYDSTLGSLQKGVDTVVRELT